MDTAGIEPAKTWVQTRRFPTQPRALRHNRAPGGNRRRQPYAGDRADPTTNWSTVPDSNQPECGLQPHRPTVEQTVQNMVRVPGIEPGYPDWQSGALPLGYTSNIAVYDYVTVASRRTRLLLSWSKCLARLLEFNEIRYAVLYSHPVANGVRIKYLESSSNQLGSLTILPSSAPARVGRLLIAIVRAPATLCCRLLSALSAVIASASPPVSFAPVAFRRHRWPSSALGYGPLQTGGYVGAPFRAVATHNFGAP